MGIVEFRAIVAEDVGEESLKERVVDAFISKQVPNAHHGAQRGKDSGIDRAVPRRWRGVSMSSFLSTL